MYFSFLMSSVTRGELCVLLIDFLGSVTFYIQNKVSNEYSVINADSALGFNAPPLIPGSAILAIKNDDDHDKKVRQLAKKIMRLALAPHLGGRPLKSRELYRRPD